MTSNASACLGLRLVELSFLVTTNGDYRTPHAESLLKVTVLRRGEGEGQSGER